MNLIPCALNILLLLPVFYFARVDGAGEEAGARHVFEFCRHFAALGHAVTLFLPDLGKRRALEGVSLVYGPF